jgi:hypothetical protein
MNYYPIIRGIQACLMMIISILSLAYFNVYVGVLVFLVALAYIFLAIEGGE